MTNENSHISSEQEVAEASGDVQENAPAACDDTQSVADTDQQEPVAPTVQTLLAQIQTLKDEVSASKEQALRAVADAQNVRRRSAQDVEKAHKFGLEKFVGDLLVVADNLERAVDSAQADGADLKAVTEGVELTLKNLLDSLKRHKVEAVDPTGEPFDPQLHQAMSMVEQADAEPNTVINVFQKGYTLHGRLVRPAMVVVSKAPAK